MSEADSELCYQVKQKKELVMKIDQLFHFIWFPSLKLPLKFILFTYVLSNLNYFPCCFHEKRPQDQAPEAGTSGNGNAKNEDSSSGDEDSDCCAICLGKLTSKKLPSKPDSGCGHMFCRECIIEWSKQVCYERHVSTFQKIPPDF